MKNKETVYELYFANLLCGSGPNGEKRYGLGVYLVSDIKWRDEDLILVLNKRVFDEERTCYRVENYSLMSKYDVVWRYDVFKAKDYNKTETLFAYEVDAKRYADFLTGVNSVLDKESS